MVTLLYSHTIMMMNSAKARQRSYTSNKHGAMRFLRSNYFEISAWKLTIYRARYNRHEIIISGRPAFSVTHKFSRYPR